MSTEPVTSQRPRLRLLYIGDATLARECLGRPGGSIEVVEALPEPGIRFDSVPFDILLVEHAYPGVETVAILKDLAARRLRVPVVIVAEWDEKLAVIALTLGAADYVLKSKASFRAVYFRLNRLIAHSSLLNEQSELRDAHASTLEQERATREQLEQRLAAALDHLADAAAAAAEHKQRESDFDERLAEGWAARQKLRQQLADQDATLMQAGQDFARRQSELEASVTEEAARRRVLEAKLAEAEESCEAAERRRLAEAAASEEKLAQQHAEFTAEIAQAVLARDALQLQVNDAMAAVEQGRRDRSADAAAAAEQLAHAAARLADHQSQAETRLAEASADADALAAKLADTAAALTRLEQQVAIERQTGAEEFAQRQAMFEAELAQERMGRQALAHALTDSEAARQRAEEQHTSDLEAAAARLADHQREAEVQAANAAAGAVALEARLADAAAALTHLERQVASERQAALEETVQRQAMVEAELTQERNNRQALAQALTDADAALTRLEQRTARERAEWETARITAGESLAATEDRIQRLETAHRQERADLERARMAVEATLVRERAEYTALQQTLEQAEAAAREMLEQASTDRATERVGLEARVAERESQFEALRAAADSVPHLRKQIDDIQAEHRRQFDQAPVSSCRCGRNGAVTVVNHALARLLGYDSPDELLSRDFAGGVFESVDELQWIIDRCLTSRLTESVETTWRKKDGSRIIVRVLAVATTTDSIDLAVQDITAVRVLEEKLRNSQRMEAVGRYSSEVATTCHNLLRQVNEEGHQWLASIDSDTARYQGASLLDEVTRAEGFLRQLTVYGNEQRNASELVDLNGVLRDLAPVLKRVAGGNIELVLPKASTPLNLDVEAERVERMLINVAAYGRERMPLGGRLMIEVASVVVDREFVAKYPNVRPGAHVLLTVNEVRAPAGADLSKALHTQTPGASGATSIPDNPGVDLGALQALVTDCGGHLWMMVEPPGHMVLKIHLPRRVLDRPDAHAPAKGSDHPRWINRVFGAHAS